MDGVDDVVGPEPPVVRRPHRVVIPGRPFQSRAPAGQRSQEKLSLPRNEKPIEMRRMHVAIRRPFLHRRGILCDGKPEQAGFVPDLHRLDERPGGKAAMPHRADTAAVNLCAHRIRDAEPEQELARRRQLRERDDVAPDSLHGRVHLDGGDHLEQGRRPLPQTLGAEHQRQREQRHEVRLRRRAAPAVGLNGMAGQRADRSQSERQRRRHQQADHTFERKRQARRPRQRYGGERDHQALPGAPRLARSVEDRRQKAHRERHARKQTPAILAQHLRAQRGRAQRQQHADSHRQRRAADDRCGQPRPLAPVGRRRPFLAWRRSLGHECERDEQKPFQDRHDEQHRQPQRQARGAEALEAKHDAEPQKRYGHRQQHGELRGVARGRKPLDPRHGTVEVRKQGPIPVKHQPQQQAVEVVLDGEQHRRPQQERRARDLPIPADEVGDSRLHGRPLAQRHEKARQADRDQVFGAQAGNDSQPQRSRVHVARIHATPRFPSVV